VADLEGDYHIEKGAYDVNRHEKSPARMG